MQNAHRIERMSRSASAVPSTQKCCAFLGCVADSYALGDLERIICVQRVFLALAQIPPWFSDLESDSILTLSRVEDSKSWWKMGSITAFRELLTLSLEQPSCHAL